MFLRRFVGFLSFQKSASSGQGTKMIGWVMMGPQVSFGNGSSPPSCLRPLSCQKTAVGCFGIYRGGHGYYIRLSTRDYYVILSSQGSIYQPQISWSLSRLLLVDVLLAGSAVRQVTHRFLWCCFRGGFLRRSGVITLDCHPQNGLQHTIW